MNVASNLNNEYQEDKEINYKKNKVVYQPLRGNFNNMNNMNVSPQSKI
jgi:hypothetical protein